MLTIPFKWPSPVQIYENEKNVEKTFIMPHLSGPKKTVATKKKRKWNNGVVAAQNLARPQIVFFYYAAFSEPSIYHTNFYWSWLKCAWMNGAVIKSSHYVEAVKFWHNLARQLRSFSSEHLSLPALLTKLCSRKSRWTPNFNKKKYETVRNELDKK